MNSIVAYLEHWAGIQPDTLFSSFLDTDGKEKETYTYKSFHERTQFLAEFLSREVGVKHGDRALLVYQPGLELIAAFFACARVGVIPVPVCPPKLIGYPQAEAKLSFIARDSGAKVALTGSGFCRSPEALSNQRRLGATSAAARSDLNWVVTSNLSGRASIGFQDDPGTILFLQYTSGSTADPRGVIVSHTNVIQNGRSTVEGRGVAVSWLPQYHDMGLIGYYLFPLLTGSTTYGFSPIDFLKRPLLWFQTISRVRATHASSPNFGFEYCLREDKIPSEELHGLDLSSLRVLMNASEPVSPDTYVRFFQRFAHFGLRAEAYVAAYGLAEHTLAATHHGTRRIEVNKPLLQQGKAAIEDARPLGSPRKQLVSCGRPLDGVHLQIVDPQSHAALGEREIGEVWLAGNSVCQGYWNRPKLTQEIFGNTIASDQDQKKYLRSGDLGFLNEGELFVCGRIKDLIIIHGVNHYPQDIEHVVQSASRKIRNGGVAAFSGDGEEEHLVVVAELRMRKDAPDAVEIARMIRIHNNIDPSRIIFVPAGAIARTSSGKIARSQTRQQWLSGLLPIISSYTRKQASDRGDPRAGLSVVIHRLLQPYDLKGTEPETLSEIGIDSLTLVMIIEEIRRAFETFGQAHVINELDATLIQCLSVSQLFSLLRQFDAAEGHPNLPLDESIHQLKYQCGIHEQERIRSDAKLEAIRGFEFLEGQHPLANILLTGPTGFFGPFLLRSLLEKTPYTYYALTRTRSAAEGMLRVREGLSRAGVLTPALERQLVHRLRVVPGDLTLPNLGMRCEDWKSLAANVQAVMHNGAMVNYVLSYDALRPTNVDGTRELLKFSFTGIRKDFHLISSTMIFGWTGKSVLLENDNNDKMANLDFGYSQSKWVAEQLVLGAGKLGLKIRVYRPSFISASSEGIGSADDIAIMMLAFMINNGISIKASNQISFLPADIVADNIATIFSQRQATDRTLHVTTSSYYNIMDITALISRAYGYPFVYLDISAFFAEVKRLCAKTDKLFCLLDFLDRVRYNIPRMQHKRYHNEHYRNAILTSGDGRHEPSLRETVSYMMAYMLREGLIKSIAFREDASAIGKGASEGR